MVQFNDCVSSNLAAKCGPLQINEYYYIFICLMYTENELKKNTKKVILTFQKYFEK